MERGETKVVHFNERMFNYYKFMRDIERKSVMYNKHNFLIDSFESF